jgi:hypothetical protein
MAVFKLVTNASEEQLVQTDVMDSSYYTVDTASLRVIHDWLRFNGYSNTYALIGEEVIGYINLMSIKAEAAILIQRQDLREEDIRSNHIIPFQSMHHAQYLYLPAITVKDFRNFRSRQAVAALLSGMASYMLNMYNVRKLKAIYANPTTFQGNILIRKMGFKPLHGAKKPLSGLDIYYTTPSENIVGELRSIEKRYAHLVSENPWPELGKVTLEKPTSNNDYHIKLILGNIENPPALDDGPFYLAKYRDEYIGVARKAEGDKKLWYGLHPRWRERGLGAKLKAAIEAV